MYIVLKVKEHYKTYTNNNKNSSCLLPPMGKQELSIYCVPGSVLGPGNTAVAQTHQIPTLPQLIL